MSLFINGRYIKNFMLTKAILSGYHTLLPVGRYPILAINIVMDPALVDVNVHPTKQEVRLSKESQLMELIERLIKEKIWKQNLIPKVEKKKVLETFQQQKFEYDLLREHRDKIKQSDYSEQTAVNQIDENFKEQHKTAQLDKKRIPDGESTQKTTGFISDSAIELDTTSEILPEKNESSDVIENIGNDTSREKRKIPYMEIVGQVHGTYIIAQNEDGMFMIDQHAAQERIKYEYFKKQIGDVGLEMQSLLIPITVTLSKDEAINLNKINILLKDIGIHLEHFGGNDYIINDIPVWFPDNYEETVQELIDYALQHRQIDLNKFREETAIMMSCKKSIKANHYLRITDMNYLLEELAHTVEPYTCPHGRPIIIQFTTYELEKLFKRVM